MKKIIILLFISACLLNCSSGKEVSMEGQNRFTGTWEGILEVAGQRLQVVFHIEYDKDRYKGRLDSPDQGAMGLPVDEVLIEENDITIIANKPGLNFKGTLQSGKITGIFKQRGYDIPLELTKNPFPQKLNRPQEPKGPFSYYSEEVFFINKKAGIQLAGTLSYPKTGGPFAAAVLITGSGSQDRNEEIFGHKPFLVLAHHLTNKGFAVLRFDDRGFGQSQGNAAAATSQDFAADAEAALEYLKTRDFIDSKKIGYIGHSEGAVICAMIAGRNSDVAYIIMLAGPGVPGDQLMLLQTRAIMEASGIQKQAIDRAVEINREIYNAITQAGRTDPAEKVAELLAKAGITGANQKAQLNILLSPWYVYFLKNNPAEHLEKVTIPVLALFGEKDVQVPYAANLKAIETALTSAGNKDFSTRSFPGLNHLFQTAQSGLMDEYGKIEETFNETVLNVISEWLSKRY